jgi:hypothetical protein
MTAFTQGSTYNSATHQMKIALWVVQWSRPFAIVEDDELLDIFHDLNSKCTTPSASTVSRDVKEIFHMTQMRVAKMLQVCSVLLCVTCHVDEVDMELGLSREVTPWC